MPQLMNARQEALAQALAFGKPQREAYAEAGYQGKTSAAITKACNYPDVLMRKAEIIAERHEIQRRAVDKAVEEASIDKAWVIKRAKYIVDRAIRGTKPVYGENGQITSWMPAGRDDGNAINGLKLLAQMGGYLIEKVEVGQPGDFARLSDKELEAELILVGESIGLDPKQVQKAIAGSPE